VVTLSVDDLASLGLTSLGALQWTEINSLSKYANSHNVFLLCYRNNSFQVHFA